MRDILFERAHPLALRAAGVRARAAVASGAVQPADREDLKQEGLIACWRALPHFNPTRASLRTFIEHVVSARMVSLHRARRCRPRFEPLEADQHPGGCAWALKIELRLDVDRVLDTLRGADRQLALALIERTPTEASRLLGIARSTVYERIHHLRTAFAGAGLHPRIAGRLGGGQ
ncbi:MAG: sigma-70 family RNA polymerase sigma factor [Bryobacteraceae bacterium]|jgi:RNA polymerase sigma factor (sigma-70 family)